MPGRTKSTWKKLNPTEEEDIEEVRAATMAALRWAAKKRALFEDDDDMSKALSLSVVVQPLIGSPVLIKLISNSGVLPNSKLERQFPYSNSKTP